LPYQHDLASPQGKTAAVEELVPALRDLADPIERAHYVQRLAAVVGVPESAIAELTRPATRRAVAQPNTVEQRPDQVEEYALALMTLGAIGTGLADNDFHRPECRGLWRWLCAGGQGAAPAELAPTWATVQALAAQHADEPPDRLRADLDSTALELRKRRLMREKQDIDSLVRDAEGAPSREQAERLRELAALRGELERAQKAHGRVVASPLRFQVVKEEPRE